MGLSHSLAASDTWQPVYRPCLPLQHNHCITIACKRSSKILHPFGRLVFPYSCLFFSLNFYFLAFSAFFINYFLRVSFCSRKTHEPSCQLGSVVRERHWKKRI